MELVLRGVGRVKRRDLEQDCSRAPRHPGLSARRRERGVWGAISAGAVDPSPGGSGRRVVVDAHRRGFSRAAPDRPLESLCQIPLSDPFVIGSRLTRP